MMQRSINDKDDKSKDAVVHQACASCKHQRKRCGEECVLAPYFPASKTQEFQAVHRVFGVSNVSKMIRNVREEDRKMVADSLIWEAMCRQRNPVLGPYAEYAKIEEELRWYKGLFLVPAAAAAANHRAPTNDSTRRLMGGTNGGSFVADQNGGPNIADHDDGSITGDYNYNNNYNSRLGQGPEKLKQERQFGHVVAPLPHQLNYSMHGFAQHYYLPGEFA